MRIGSHWNDLARGLSHLLSFPCQIQITKISWINFQSVFFGTVINAYLILVHFGCEKFPCLWDSCNSSLGTARLQQYHCLWEWTSTKHISFRYERIVYHYHRPRHMYIKKFFLLCSSSLEVIFVRMDLNKIYFIPLWKNSQGFTAHFVS